MRIGQLQSLTQDELALLLYIVNVIDPISIPKMEFGPKELLWFKHDALLWKLAQQEPKLTPEGKEIFQGLMSKLNKTPQQEQEEYERASKPLFIQSDFQF